jgi:hypothetical protein
MGTSPTYIVTTQIPLGPRPYRSTGKGLERTRKHDEPPPQHNFISNYGLIMKIGAMSQT